MLSRLVRLNIAAATLLVSTFSVAQAAPGGPKGCHVRIDTPSANWVIEGYDPFGSDLPDASHEVLFVNQGDEDCRILPQFVTDGSVIGLEGPDGKRIGYSLADVTRGVDMTPVAGRTPRRADEPVLTIAAGTQQLVRYLFRVDPALLTSDGRFTQRLFLVAGDDRKEFASKPVLLGLHIRPTAMLGMSGAFRRSNGQADVDLGELRAGLVALPLQLHVRSTRAYSLQFKSRHAGSLRFDGSSQWSIPYDLYVGDKRADLTSGTALEAHAVDSGRSDNLPLGFFIGSTENVRAGRYEDLITITIAVR